MSAGTLLAAGLWPGALRAADRSNAGSFRFLVVNDTHYLSPECGAWLTGAVRQMKGERAEFCLLCGDLVEDGGRDQLAAVRDIFSRLGAPVYPQIGNHDYLTPTDRRAYEKLFPRRLNYWFAHRGWQFVGLDTSDGQRYTDTLIQRPTFAWLDDHLRRFDRNRPTVIFTHFPLGDGVTYQPGNADELLERFRPYNLQTVFSGHFHGFTERQAGRVTLVTNRCCALKRNNHDNTTEKGYFVCDATEGRITRRFVEVKPPA